MESILKRYSPEIIEKAGRIKALIFDVDGVMTDGGLYYKGNDKETKKFHVRDGQIIKPLNDAEIRTGIITGRESMAVERRALELGINFYAQGVKDKFACYEELMERFELDRSEVAYIGDDYPDLPILEDCSLSACPSDAPIYIQDRVDIVTTVRGGQGVIREVADLLLASPGQFPFLKPGK